VDLCRKRRHRRRRQQTSPSSVGRLSVEFPAVSAVRVEFSGHLLAEFPSVSAVVAVEFRVVVVDWNDGLL